MKPCNERGDDCNERMYHGECTKSAMDNKIGHVTDDISGETNVEKHVEHVERLLTCINRMQIAITHGGECDNGPVH